MSTGIIDGPHHFFECSKCKAPLVDIWVNHVDKSLKWNFVVECPHCGGRSYQQTVYGSFFIGGTEESEKYTVIDNYELSDDPIIIKTKKVTDYVSKRN